MQEQADTLPVICDQARGVLCLSHARGDCFQEYRTAGAEGLLESFLPTKSFLINSARLLLNLARGYFFH